MACVCVVALWRTERAPPMRRERTTACIAVGSPEDSVGETGAWPRMRTDLAAGGGCKEVEEPQEEAEAPGGGDCVDTAVHAAAAEAAAAEGGAMRRGWGRCASRGVYLSISLISVISPCISERRTEASGRFGHM